MYSQTSNWKSHSEIYKCKFIKQVISRWSKQLTKSVSWVCVFTQKGHTAFIGEMSCCQFFWVLSLRNSYQLPKYIHNSSALEYICSLYHKELQVIAKVRWITIDLYKSCLVTIETPRNHNSSQHQIVFAIVEKYVGIVMNFLISKKGLGFQSTLKLHKNYDPNYLAPTHTSLRRLCPQPPDPNTIQKLRLSAFCMCY